MMSKKTNTIEIQTSIIAFLQDVDVKRNPFPVEVKMHDSNRASFARNMTKSETRQQYKPMGINRNEFTANLNMNGHPLFLLTLYISKVSLV